MYADPAEAKKCGFGFLSEPFPGVREFAKSQLPVQPPQITWKFQAVIKLAAGGAVLRGGRASRQLGHYFFSQFLAALAAHK